MPLSAPASRWLITALVVSGVASGSAALFYFIFKRYRSKEVDEGYSEVAWSGEPLPKKILVLGLDGAGKSMLLQSLTNPTQIPQTTPTEGFNVITIQTRNRSKLDIWEIGGSEAVRRYWTKFIEDIQVLVFVIDSADRRRFPDAYTEMHKLLGEPRLLQIPFVVLANKQDVEGAASSAEIKEALGLEDVKHHRVKILNTSFNSLPASGLEQVRQLLYQV